MATYTGEQYRLRAGSPMPTSTPSRFVLQSFMASVQETDIETCITDIKSSSSFRGQGGGFMSASYSRLPLSEERYSGKVVANEVYHDESYRGYN